MDKDELKEQTEKDFQGNWRFKDSKKLVHRWVAYKYIYLKDRKKYPLEFKDYQVHHKDRNKNNNGAENLELIPRAEHEKRHGIIRRERLEINYVKVGALGILAIFGADWLSNKLGITGIRKTLIFVSILITIFALMLLISREKEGVKYVWKKH